MSHSCCVEHDDEDDDDGEVAHLPDVLILLSCETLSSFLGRQAKTCMHDEGEGPLLSYESVERPQDCPTSPSKLLLHLTLLNYPLSLRLKSTDIKTFNEKSNSNIILTEDVEQLQVM